MPECNGDFIDWSSPSCSRGACTRALCARQHAHKLFGQGDRLPAHHHAQQFRQQPSVGGASVAASPSSPHPAPRPWPEPPSRKPHVPEPFFSAARPTPAF
ncbi:hypothetical protein ACFODQ_00865, partial [Comamonas sp. JC664]